jgi:hypothetical protein
MLFNRHSILVVTGQAWKVAVMFVSAVVFGATVAWIGLAETSVAWRFDVMRLAALSFAVSLGLCFTSLRCPKCRDRYFWRIAKNVDAGAWVQLAMTTRVCPRCGYSPQGQ